MAAKKKGDSRHGLLTWVRSVTLDGCPLFSWEAR
jgi:hypothetical protein